MARLYVLVIVFLCLNIDIITSRNNINTDVDLVIDKIEHENWTEDERTCLEDTLFVLHNVKNHTVWAVWMWNSMDHPTGTFYGSRYNLGNYDQCLKTPAMNTNRRIVAQYCLADVKLVKEINITEGHYVSRKINLDLGAEEYFSNPNMCGTADKFLAIRMKMGRKINVITWGFCLPASCKPSATTKIIKAIYKTNPITAGDPDIYIANCEIAGQKQEFDTKFFVFISLITVLVFTAILSSVYRSYFPLTTCIIASSFDIKCNWSSFTKKSTEDIPVITFTKAFHVIFTTCIHILVFSLPGALTNSLDFDSAPGIKDNILGNVFAHCDLLSIENFTLISGLLYMYGLLSKRRNLLTSLVQRYIRLFATFSIIIFYMIAVAKYTGDGPMWQKLMGREEKACAKNWIISLLMLNNYIDAENICVIVSWYIPFDFQLTVIGTILFYVYQKHQRIGLFTIASSYLFYLVVPGIHTYKEQLPGILMYNIEAMVHPRSNVYYLKTHIKSHLRGGSYILGMAMAFILFKYNPTKYRGIISQRWSYPILVAAFALGLKVLSDAPAWCLGEYNALYSAVYMALNTQLWSIATLICVAVNEYGELPTLRRFMSWHGFTLISRLAYGIYLTHSLILQRGFFLQRGPRYFDTLDMTIYVIGVLLVSSFNAVLLWLFVEAPLCNLTNYILMYRRNRNANIIGREENVAEKLKNK